MDRIAEAIGHLREEMHAIRADIGDYRRCSELRHDRTNARLDDIDAKMAKLDEVAEVYSAAGVTARVVKWIVGTMAGLAAVWVVLESWFRKHPPVGG